MIHRLFWVALGFVLGGFFPAWALVAAKWAAAQAAIAWAWLKAQWKNAAK